MAAQIATLQENRILGKGSQTFVRDSCRHYIAQDLANSVVPFWYNGSAVEILARGVHGLGLMLPRRSIYVVTNWNT